ncbi:MAG: hypothetical protein R6X33_19620 [Candidatus Brocadiia bacterium]
MSDEEKTPEPEATEGEVPQGVADGLAALSTDVRTLAQMTARGWKITAVVFIVLLIVIAGYLGYIRARLGGLVDAESVVGMGFDRVNAMLEQNYGAPHIASDQMPKWVAGRLEEMAPQVMNDQVRPLLQDVSGRLPEIRQEMVARIEANAPQYVDKGMTWFTDEMLPQAEDTFIREMKRATSQIVDRVEEDLERIVAEVMEQHQEDLRTLSPEQMPQIRRAMEAEIEEKMGPILDEMFEGVGQHLRSVRTHMQELVNDYKAERLTYDDRLEIQLIRLVRQLFELKAIQQDEPTESLFQSLMQRFDISELGEPVREDIRQAVPEGAVNWQEIPAEDRETVRQILQQQGVQMPE